MPLIPCTNDRATSMKNKCPALLSGWGGAISHHLGIPNGRRVHQQKWLVHS